MKVIAVVDGGLGEVGFSEKWLEVVVASCDLGLVSGILQE